MATTQPPRTERPRFYEQQYLGARDLTRIVDYVREARARHDLGAHIWGIAAGLQLVEKPSKCGGPLELYLEPGFAWDGFGRPIAVLAPLRVSPALFDSLTYEASDAGPPPGRLVPLWIRYRESAVGGPPPGFEICSGEDQFSRTLESYQIVAGVKATHAERHDPVSVAGYDVDAREVPARLEIPGPVVAGAATTPTLDDESVPYQSYPDDGDARWLVPLGVVRWLPPNGAAAGGFEARVESASPDPTVGPRDLTSHERARRYIGVVAGTVNAAGATIRLRSRDGDFTPAVWTSELAWVEGDARVDGDVSLLDGRLVFRDGDYRDHGAPLTIGRREANTLGGRDLVAQIGAGETGVNRLVIGPMVVPPAGGGATLREKVVVKDDGSVGIGETNPDRPLVVRGRAAGQEAIGLEDAAGSTRWSLALNGGGVPGFHLRDVPADATRLYVKEGGDVGIGTTAPTQNLHVQGSRGIRQNELYISGGDGSRWSSLSFNAHHNAANTAWVFPNPGRRAITVEMDDSGGTPRCEVWSTTAGNPTGFIRRLAIDGEIGTVLLAPNGGDVGIGTNAPQNHLHVDGGSGLRVGRLHMSGGGAGNVGSSIAYNSYRNAANSAFVFPDPARTAVTVEMDDWNGLPRFEVWSTTTGARNMWQQRLRINGESGDFIVAHTGGRAGVGTTTPQVRLHVADSASGTDNVLTNHVAVIENTSGTNNADVLALKVGATFPGTGNNFITFFAGGRAMGSIESDSLATGISWNSSGADMAEWMPRADGEPPMRPGDVAGVHGGRVSRRLEGAERLMVVSTSPMIVGNRPPDDRRRDFERMVFIGRAPVRVRGPVARGDVILAEQGGDGAGVAVRPDALGLRDLPRVVAVAWEDAAGPGERAVQCGVGLGPPRRVWSLLAEMLERPRGHDETAGAAPPPRPRLKRKHPE
jgi:hypothetical protein